MSQRSCHLQHEPRSLVSRPRLGLTSESGKGALLFVEGTRTMDCDNRDRRIKPAFCMGYATTKLTIMYNAVETDRLDLCRNCADVIALDARRHGYRTSKLTVRA